ncbi:IS5 family transposase [Chondrinema litorale]|uniref:IS5 family transposase n=1 Tax=Chondrinema litorale TaxID=2994555 RepID=UPI002543E964|nr:IS5 family transposase [Chondrinema litorale]UZR99609.1 IS5 family transposase [Chondrinema litorale]
MPACKDIYKPRNWKAYNASLCMRGSLTLWLSAGVYRDWCDISKQDKVVGEKHYSDLIIELCLTIRQVYRLPLRQCTGFLKSIFSLMGLSDLAVPNYSTLSRRASGLDLKLSGRPLDQKMNIAVDSTGLKVYGEGEWKVRKHGITKRRTWRKLHLGIDLKSQQIVACVLTDNSVDDAEAVSAVLAQVTAPLGKFYGDGAYDKKKCRRAIYKRGGDIIIPPAKNAVISKEKHPELISRNQAIERIEQIGRRAWKLEAGYHKRSLSEVAMHRYKGSISSGLNARKFENQVTEAKLGCHILNIFNRCGMPNSVKI